MTMFGSKKKILFLIHGFDVGGAENFLINLVNRLNFNIIDPIVVALKSDKGISYKLRKDVKVYFFPRKWKYDLNPANEIADLIQKEDITEAFVIGNYCYFFFYLAVRKLNRNIQSYISLHSTIPRSLKDFIQNFIYLRLIDDNVKLITICKNQADYLSKKYFINKDKFITIYNGVDTDYWTFPSNNFNKTEFKKKFDIDKDSFVIIKVATFRKEKNHKGAIKSLNILHKKYGIKAYLLFVGGGNEKYISELRNYSEKYNLSEYVKFCGAQDDVRPYYWISDLFTLSSTKIETFSISALEAMACGLPCVLTNIGGASEMIIENINGYLAKPRCPSDLAQKWHLAYINKNKFNKNIIRNIIVENFSLDVMVNNYEQYLSR